MREQCLDEGTIQSFLDGELAPELLENVARHTALCDSCARFLIEAEEESAFAFSILDEEFNLPVPTERIRANVFQAIAQIEEPKVSLWEKFWRFASILSNPNVAAFASLVIVVGIFAIVLTSNKQNGQLLLAVNSTQTTNQISSKNLPDKKVVDLAIPSNNGVEKVNYKPEKNKVQRPRVEDQNPNILPLVYHPKESVDGEDTYLKTIATLENTIKDKKDSVLRASSRVSFERDLAVVNDSIKRMKDEVRKHPKNEAAKQILRNSYQNKIELLNSVSERSEFIARMD
ncbi:MAG: hypothetical protein K1X72_03720 [Pyrinomonadaceae bacterium]|nr:hypothetical protein [Pyrinomonadaceae bacterium]